MIRGNFQKVEETLFLAPRGVAHSLNVLDAVSTVGSENFTEQSSNILSDESLGHA